VGPRHPIPPNIALKKNEKFKSSKYFNQSIWILNRTTVLVKKDEKRGRTNFLPQCFSQWCRVHLARSWKWPARVWTPAKVKYKKYREKKGKHQ
jgi:hypothetical protein